MLYVYAYKLLYIFYDLTIILTLSLNIYVYLPIETPRWDNKAISRQNKAGLSDPSLALAPPCIRRALRV